MPRSLVVVESPAKARTIAGFLGPEFIVKSSMGHVRDLESKGLSVDVDNGFKPTYVVNGSKKDVIKELRGALADVDELYLATDEDREGEAISWHLLEVLNPKVPVKRMVFHEITRSAIERSVEQWREIDLGLVDAQETRRIVDRLFGYPVSELLWRKVSGGLSAGRVQSVATRLVVERERDRMRFVVASYWDVEAVMGTSPAFKATLVALDGRRVASGRDFDESGRPSTRAGAGDTGVVVLDETAARGLAARLEHSAFTVRSVEEKPYRSKPKAPFMTSTLQQEGGRKLRMTAQQVMRVAQGLYERGFITYMRTDSVALSDAAVAAARSQVRSLYGDAYLPDAPRRYTGKVKNAQEAHEAIRPAGDQWRTADDIGRELTGTDLRLYDLIWKRTVASQMADATGRTLSVRLAASSSSGEDAELAASGRTITFPGYLRAYVEGSDDPEADLDDRETVLPPLAQGDPVPLDHLEAQGHSTAPPARYTEASLVKRLEELGVGRPSTYASIMGTIQDRGYVWKKASALVPTWTAFAVVNLLERHFARLVDYAFTARMEDDLDQIAGRRQERVPWLSGFWFGDGAPGLAALVEQGRAEIDPAEINSIPLGTDDAGEAIVVRNGRYGPYLKRGEDTASVPPDIAPDELTVARAVELLAAPKNEDPIGTDPDGGLPVYAKSGRFGPYVQLGDAETLPEGEKPKMASLFATMSLETLTMDQAMALLSRPPRGGGGPPHGEEISAQNGRYGPYLKHGKETRSLDSEDRIFTVTVQEATALLAQPKTYGRRGAPKPPLRELGDDPGSGRPIVVKDGRFGPYVTDGETNASLRRSDSVDELTPERAAELLADKRAQGPAAPKKAGSRRAAATKAPTAPGAGRKRSAKEPAAKKPGAKKRAAKKPAARKPAARKPAGQAAATRATTGEADRAHRDPSVP